MRRSTTLSLLATTAVVLTACEETKTPTAIDPQPEFSRIGDWGGGRGFQFSGITPLTGDAACLDVGAILNDPTDDVFQLPKGFRQKVIGRQSDMLTSNAEVNFDMLTLNETGRDRGRYLYRTHEVRPFAALSRIDLRTGENELLVERADWESFDGLVWTPWRTILMAEERIVQTDRDPDFPDIERGLVYEYFPNTGEVVARPAVGARSHEGLRFDRRGNLYGISESRGLKNAGAPGESGAIFKFVPDRRGDLSSGQLYALRVRDGARTGPADWVPLDLDPVTFDSDAAAQAVNATAWDRPEDVDVARVRGQEVLYVAVTESSDLPQDNGLVLRIELDGDEAYVSNYVEPGVNVLAEVGDPFDSDAGMGFDDPDNLAIAPNGDLYITEDDSPGDIWVARGSGRVADEVEVFARLLDCSAEPSGIYFDGTGKTLWVNSQHAGLNGGEDLTLEITMSKKHGDDDDDDHDHDDDHDDDRGRGRSHR